MLSRSGCECQPCSDYRKADNSRKRDRSDRSEYLRQWREANKDRVREYEKSRSSKFPGRSTIFNRRRRARLRKIASDRYTLEDLYEESGGVCCLCEQPVDMSLSGLDPWGPTVDHAMPISLGGDDTIDNVQLAHRRCNTIKGANPWAFI